MANEESTGIVGYLILRRLLGIFGMLLPIVLVVFTGFTFQPSISHYYYTYMGFVFVGFLCAFGAFLILYKYKSSAIDNWLTTVAGICALCAAFVPTSTGDRCLEIKCTIHFTSAALFFLLLAYMAYFRFTRSDKKPAERTSQKRRRNRVYRNCAVIIVACLLLLGVYYLFRFKHQWPYETAFWLETIALEAFGFAWLIKGKVLMRDSLVVNVHG